jgi:threonine/homoserine/homoserine lactone efflux protein
VLELFYTGMIIGVLVSSPMGPVGMLCIQRTLAKGRWSGFVSSAGAALSDLIYAAVTSLFLGLIVNFVEAHQRPLQIFGSIVIAVFGCYIFRNNPVKSLQRNQDQKQSLIQDFVTAFLLTFSNVLIIFLFIGLYTRFGFVLPEHTVRVTVAGLMGIFAGAMMWWFLITFIVSLFRRWFNIRGLRVMNRIVGSVIFLLAVLGLISSIWLIK